MCYNFAIKQTRYNLFLLNIQFRKSYSFISRMEKTICWERDKERERKRECFYEKCKKHRSRWQQLDERQWRKVTLMAMNMTSFIRQLDECPKFDVCGGVWVKVSAVSRFLANSSPTYGMGEDGRVTRGAIIIDRVLR